MKLAFGKGKKEAGPETREVISRVVAEPRWGLHHIGLMLGLAILLLAGGITLFFQQQALEQRAENARARATLTATLLADRLAAEIRSRAERMERLARDPALIAALANPDRQARDRHAQRLRVFFPDAVAVRLLPPGLKEVQPRANPPISFATLDMLRQAETSDRPPPAEVHLVGQPGEHINIDRIVLDAEGRHIVGHLLVSLPTQLLEATLPPARVVDGQVTIRQKAAGRAVVLAATGDKSLQQQTPASVAKVPGTRWEVAVRTPPLPATLIPQGMPLLVAGSGALVCLVLLVAGLRWYRRLLTDDQTLLLGALRDARHTGLKTEYPIRIIECMPMLKGIVRLFSDDQPVVAAGARPVPAAPVTAPSEAPEAPAASTPVTETGDDSEFEVLDESALASPADTGKTTGQVDPAIFRAYDIRGVYGENLDETVAELIGRAVGSDALARGETAIFVGRDGRLSSPQLAEALIRGLCATGIDVKDLGEVPTPVLYFATHQREESRSGVMVTGSHNPPEYNGMKIVLAGETLHGSGIQALRHLIEHRTFMQGQGAVETLDLIGDYVQAVAADIQIPRPLRVVVDCGHGVAARVVPALMSALECELIPLNCEVDGHFPAHHPDPGNPENLTGLIQAVQENSADLGLAFDGDGDRLGVVDSDGNIIWPDRLMMLLAMDVLSRNPGADVLFDVKCSRHLGRIIRDFGGNPEMWKTGHSLLKARMKETGALLAGEMSGHIFYADRWFGFDDALYAAARLIEIVANDHRPSARIFAVLPESVSTPMIEIPLEEGEEKTVMERVVALADFPDAEVTTIDGLRADFADGWGLIRASNTTPSLTLRFEADDEDALERIRQRFRDLLKTAAPELEVPF